MSNQGTFAAISLRPDEMERSVRKAMSDLCTWTSDYRRKNNMESPLYYDMARVVFKSLTGVMPKRRSKKGETRE